MKKKILALLLAAVLMLSGTVCLFTTTATAATVPTVTIGLANLSFRDAICIKYGVLVTNSTAIPRMLVWTEPQDSLDDYVLGTEKVSLDNVGNTTYNGKRYKVFDYTGLPASYMTDIIYTRAYVEVGGSIYYSEVKKFSVMDYAFSILGKTTGTPNSNVNLYNLMKTMLDYGAAAQIYTGHNADRLANADFYQINVEGGTLSDACTSGWYLANEDVSLVAPATKNGATFSHWKNSEGKILSTNPVCTVQAEAKNDTYTAVYDSNNVTVSFLDYDGSVLATQTVAKGGTVSAPASPVRKGYTFAAWDGALTNVAVSKNVTATYTEADNQIFFEYAETDDTFTVTVSVAGNVNFYGLETTIGYTATGVQTPAISYKAAGLEANLVDNGVAVSFVGEGQTDVTEPITLLTLTFAKTATPTFSATLNDTDMFSTVLIGGVHESVDYTVAGNNY